MKISKTMPYRKQDYFALAFLTILLFLNFAAQILESYFGIAFLSLGNYSLPGLLIIGVIFAGVFLLLNKRKIEYIFLIPLLFVIAEVISTLLSRNILITNLPMRIIEMAEWVCFLFLYSYFSSNNIVRKKTIDLFYFFFLVMCIFFFITYFGETEKKYIAYNSVFYCIFFLPFLLLQPNKKLKIFGLILIVFIALMSYKRSCVLMLLIGFTYYILSLNHKASFSKKIKIFLGVVVLVALVYFILQFLSKNMGIDWIERFIALKDDKGSNRLDIWLVFFKSLEEQNFSTWIFGNGYHAGAILGGAHNDILEILYDFGIIGLLIYFIFLYKMFNLGFKMKKNRFSNYNIWVFSLILFAIYSFFGQMIIEPYWFLLLCCYWGIEYSNYKNYLNEMEFHSYD